MQFDLSFLIDAPQTLAKNGDAGTSWVQVAKTGTFNDPRYGEFKITASDFNKWIANFQSLVLDKGRLGLPADVDHSPEKRGETEAVGWIKQLERRSDELWARVEWNTLGKDLIEQKRYAYISPSYSQHYKDENGQDHGQALVGIALTNRPFLQMATVNLSQYTFAQPAPPADDDDADDVDMLPHMLDISDTQRQKHAVVVKKVNGKTTHMFPIPPGDQVHAKAALSLLPRAIAAGHITQDEAAAIRARARSVLGTGKQSDRQHDAYSHRQMELTQILTALNVTLADLGVDEKADEPTVLAALAKHQAKPTEPVEPPKPPEGQVMLSQEQVTQLVADATAGRTAAEQLRVTKFESAFSLAQDQGKVVLAQKETFKGLFDKDGDGTLKLLSELQPVVNMTPSGSGGAPLDLSQAAQALAGAYTDSVTPMQVDVEGLKILTAAEAIQAAKNIPFEQALQMAEAGVTV